MRRIFSNDFVFVCKSVGVSLLVVSALTLQACSITYYQMRNRMPEIASSKRPIVCPAHYSLSVKRYGVLITLEARETPDTAFQFNKYIQAAKEVFIKKGCDPAYTENPDKADFRIQVVASPALDEIPRERLTLYSLGFIPSWGVQEKEFQYTFENVVTKKSLTYVIDRPVYNHIVFLPVFWLSFVGLEETKPFKKALINFIDNSKAPPIVNKPKIRTKGA